MVRQGGTSKEGEQQNQQGSELPSTAWQNRSETVIEMKDRKWQGREAKGRWFRDRGVGANKSATHDATHSTDTGHGTHFV